jgi:FkbM family methyltransferase
MSWKIPKTVLGDKIEWDLSVIPGRPRKGRWTGKDDQLWRCRKTKKFEASLLENLPHGACFVDAGAHFGDTVMTMAIHARDALHREDIRFVAFEPNARKARFIEECAAANGLSSETLRVISCVLGDETSIGGAVARRDHGRDWCEFDGRTSYTKVAPRDGDENSVVDVDDDDSSDSSSCNVLLDVHRLDDYYDLIHPLGFLHIDVEGWEPRVIAGASSLLSSPVNPTEASSRCYVLAETFSKKEARSRGPGFSETHEDDILKVMRKFSFTRGDDVVDIERNLFFARS